MTSNSPWEGGSRPVATSETAVLVESLINQGSHVEARLVATGILDLMNDFANAEQVLDTHPGEVLKAFAACAAGVFAGVIVNAGAPENRDDLAKSCGALVAEFTKLSIAATGGE